MLKDDILNYTENDNLLNHPGNNKNGTMGKKLDKFLLLMWKNWLLQYRRPVQTIVEIMAPVLFSILLVVIRSLVDPGLHSEISYEPFCTIPVPINIFGINLCKELDDSNGTTGLNNFTTYRNYSLLYSPKNRILDNAMSFFQIPFKEVLSFDDSENMTNFLVTNSTDMIFAAVQFDDVYKNIQDENGLNNLKVALRFPSETRFQMDPLNKNDWKTNLIYPIFQMAGPRSPNSTTGAAPNYFLEGFLALQHFLTFSIILARNKFNFTSNSTEIFQWLQANPMPMIYMKRFPYAEWHEDLLLTPLISMLGVIIMLSFVYPCINTVKTITTEKEKQLKEAMKIMGLPNWLHWTAWFVKSFVFLFISAILMVILLKVKWYSNTDFTVFTHADPSVMLVFLTFYVCSIVTFCFAVSVFFSKANTAATIAAVFWFMSYAPYIFLQEQYDTLSLGVKLIASLGANCAMSYGFQVMLMYEGTGEGIQWSNIFTPNTRDDSLTLAWILLMLVIDTILYLLIALYVEAVFPGEYGVPQHWAFPFTAKFWCPHARSTGVENFDDYSEENIKNEFFEQEPQNLQAGIRITNLRKTFGKNDAVRNLSLNMFANQITVLLGHNGAGKTTTMSMLTGMITPSSGTAKVNGCDIRTEMDQVRSSLGLCPQHNIIFDDLTVSEHLYFFSKLKGLSKDEINSEIDKYINLLEFEDKRNSKSSKLSGGMKRKLCVGIALCGNSKVVMLDEPTAGMDPSARRALWNLLQKQKQGRTMLLTTHFMDEADLLGDRIAIMAGGLLQCCGSSFFLKKKYGAGYSLIMDKSKTCDVPRVTALLMKYIPDIEVHSNVGSELTYLLAENYSSVFELMLHDLEEHFQEIGVLNYGISLTTLEEVFMKVGADHGQEEQYNKAGGDLDNVQDLHENGKDAKKETTVDMNIHPASTTGFGLIENHCLAMLIKKIISTARSWKLLLIQIFLPVLFLIIAIVVSRNQKRTGDLPAMPLTLDKFENPVTFLETIKQNDYTDAYKHILQDQSRIIEVTDNITTEMMSLTKTVPATVRRRYIAAATFETVQLMAYNVSKATAWFNNDPYHSPAISLGLVLNSVFRQVLQCDTCLIEYSNYPLPYSVDSQINQILSGQTMGFQLAFNIGFSMAFVSSFYILFTVKENISKSKHLQHVSGVKVYIFWIIALICDLVTFIVTVLAVLITLVSFQEDGFNTSSDIGRMFLIFLCFGWAFLPMMYLAAYFFDVPSTGYTRMSLFSIFTGVGAFLVIQVLSTPGLDLEDVGAALHWVFLIIPHYSLATGISESYKTYAYSNVCNKFYDLCRENVNPDMTNEQCIELVNPTYRTICEGMDGNYFKWKSPGIGRNLTYSFIVGAILFIIILLVDYKMISKLRYLIKQKYFAKQPPQIKDEDPDVADERNKIRNTPQTEICEEYILALRDMTKYYSKFLAVNSLCLGVKKYECFGLLGVNGAGKTTTFKMMTGDVKISYGDGFVNGFSIKRQIKQVQKEIGYCPQFDALLDDMTARETIKVFALLRGIRYEDCDILAENLAREFDFFRHLDKEVKQLSGGNKRKLSTSISLIGDPPVIYLDEPTTGMDPATKRHLWNAICKYRDNGKCIVLTSHSMEECEALCTRLAIMVNGNFKCLGSTQHLKSKFAEGYSLTIKIKKIQNSSLLPNSEIERLETSILQSFPGSTLRERHQELLTYYITDKSVPWSKMFGKLEELKRADLNVEDYSLGQSSLEQVFLTFTRDQH